MIAIKTGVNKQGMAWTQYATDVRGYWRGGSTHRNKFRVFGRDIGFDERQMHDLGQFALDTLKDRVTKGIGSDDATMKPLKKGYAIWKSKAGAGNRRNMTLSGRMLDSFQIRSVSDREVRMDITGRQYPTTAKGVSVTTRDVARQNELRSPWFGWSPADVSKIVARAWEMFRGGIQGISAVFVGRSGTVTRAGGVASISSAKKWTSSRIWMDPLGYHSANQKISVKVSGGRARMKKAA